MIHSPQSFTFEDVRSLEGRIEKVEESHARHRNFEVEVVRSIEGVKLAFEAVKVKVSLMLWLAGAIAVGAITTAGAVIASLITKGHP
jgi:hypothetical protein